VGFSIGWKDWVAQRIYHTLELANHAEPLAIKASEYLGTVSFVAGPGLNQARRDSLNAGCSLHRRGFGSRARTAGARRLAVPLPEPRSFPFVYLGSLVLILIVGAFLVRSAVVVPALRHEIAWTGPCFSWAAHFFSSRPRNLSQLSLLFGATWVTNAVVFSSIFAMAIAANLIVQRWPVPRLPLLLPHYGLRSCQLFAPFSELTQLSPLARA